MKTILNSTVKLSIIEYPTGKYGYVGSVPIELCEKIPPRPCNRDGYASLIFDTEIEAKDFAREKGYLL